MRNWGETTPKNMELKLPLISLMTGDGAHLVPSSIISSENPLKIKSLQPPPLLKRSTRLTRRSFLGEWIKHRRNGSQTKILIPKKRCWEKDLKNPPDCLIVSHNYVDFDFTMVESKKWQRTIRIDLGQEPFSTPCGCFLLSPSIFGGWNHPNLPSGSDGSFPQNFHQSEVRNKNPNGYLFGYVLGRYFMNNSSSRCEGHRWAWLKSNQVSKKS